MSRGRCERDGVLVCYFHERDLTIHVLCQQLYDGLAVVEAVKLGGYTQLSYVGVEVMSAANQKIVVKGDDEAMDFESDLRGLISFKSDHMKK
jgi:hypothetical protein